MLPALLGVLGSGLASAGMLGSLSPLLAGAIGSGLGGYMQTGDLKSGLLSGIGAYAGGSLMGGGAGDVTAAGGNNVSAWTPDTATPGLFGSGAGGGIMGMLQNGYGVLGTGGLVGGMLGASLGGYDQGGFEDERNPSRVSREPFNRDMTPAPAGYRPGKDPEHRYFQPIYRPTGYADTIRMADGGIVSAGMSPNASNRMALMNQQNAAAATIPAGAMPMSQMELFQKAGPLAALLGGQGAYMKDGKVYRANKGGAPTVPQVPQQSSAGPTSAREALMARRGTRRMATGGIVDMAPTPPMEQPQADPKQIVKQASDMEIVRGATMAIKGLLTDKEAAMVLAEFIERNGEEKFNRLLKDVQEGKAEEFSRDAEGMISGPGGPTDDMVPAIIADTGEPALLSDGEFVVPAEEVAAAGGPSGVKQAVRQAAA